MVFLSREDSIVLSKLLRLANGQGDIVADAIFYCQKPRYRKSLWEKITGKPGTVYVGDCADMNDVIEYIVNHP